MWTMIGAIALTASGLTAPVDKTKWARTYAENETQTYEIKATMEGGGAKLDLTAEVVFKVKTKTSKGANLAMSTSKFTILMDGSDAGASGPDELFSEFRGDGIPQLMSTENYAWIYILAASCGIVPTEEVEVGKSFNIDWKADDRTSSVKGSGKLAEWVEREGKKAGRIEYQLEVNPSDPTPGVVKCSTFVDRESGAPIACEGSVDVDSGSIKFSVKRLK